MLFLSVYSCDDSIEISNYSKDMLVLYSAFNLKDTVQYIRVEKTFLSGDDGAGNAAKIYDSVYPDPDNMEVILEVWKNDQMVEGPYTLEGTKDIPKNPGYFISSANLVYIFRGELKPGAVYRLLISDSKHDLFLEAETRLLGTYNCNRAFIENRAFHIRQYDPEYMPDYKREIDYLSDFKNRVVRFCYYNIKDGEYFKKFVDWRPYYQPLDFKKYDDTSKLQFTDAYLRFLAHNIPVKPDIVRQAVGVDYMITIADDNLWYYLLNCENSDILHYTGYYSNIENGLGIFASRYFYTYFAKRLTPETIDTLANGRFTKQLNFLDVAGS